MSNGAIEPHMVATFSYRPLASLPFFAAIYYLNFICTICTAFLQYARPIYLFCRRSICRLHAATSHSFIACHFNTPYLHRDRCHVANATSTPYCVRSSNVANIKPQAAPGEVSMRPLLYQFILFFLTVTKVMNEEQRINVCKTSVSQIYTMLRSSPQEWRKYLNLARSVIAHIDTTTFMIQPSRITEQTWMIAGLQRLAFADNGEVLDIAAWCARQWSVIYQRDPHNVAALRGIGQAWLARAQPALSRIHQIDGSSSSSGGSSQWSAPSITSSEDERQNLAMTAEAERRSGTADYVEARGYLQPAIEYLERAVAAAPAQRALSGDLLVMVWLA